jgi:ribonuclease HII
MNKETIRTNYKLIAGVDEVGRGCLYGPVIAAAVILDSSNIITGLADSKKLTALKREKLYYQITSKSISYAIGRAETTEIDQLNILQASLLAMKRAIMALSVTPEYLLIDGNFIPDTKYAAKAIINGDNIEPAIAAASIIAKVTRDNEMVTECSKWPQYGISQHKGYPTKKHIDAIKKHGVTPLHRKSFAPVRKLLL